MSSDRFSMDETRAIEHSWPLAYFPLICQLEEPIVSTLAWNMNLPK